MPNGAFRFFLHANGLRHDTKKGFLSKRKQGSTVTLRKRLGVPLFYTKLKFRLSLRSDTSRNLEMDVETHAEDVVVASIVGRVVDACLSIESHALAGLLVIVEGVEIGHVEIHLLVDVVNTADGYRVGANHKRLVVHILV